MEKIQAQLNDAAREADALRAEAEAEEAEWTESIEESEARRDAMLNTDIARMAHELEHGIDPGGPAPVGILNYYAGANIQGDLPMPIAQPPADGITLTGPDGLRIEVGSRGALAVTEEAEYLQEVNARVLDPARIKRTWQELHRRTSVLSIAGVPAYQYRFTVLMDGVQLWGDAATVKLSQQVQACLDAYNVYNFKLMKKALWAAVTKTWDEYEDNKREAHMAKQAKALESK